jgi:KDO2-lipid IV(A) lauroyltransferase
MSYQLVMLDPIRIKKSGDRDRDIQLILEKMTRALEDAIRQHPEQYLWAHRRWK